MSAGGNGEGQAQGNRQEVEARKRRKGQENNRVNGQTCTVLSRNLSEVKPFFSTNEGEPSPSIGFYFTLSQLLLMLSCQTESVSFISQGFNSIRFYVIVTEHNIQFSLYID